MVYLVRIVLRLGWKERSDKGEQQTYTDIPDYFHLDYYGVSSVFEGVAYDGVFAPFEVKPAESFAP